MIEEWYQSGRIEVNNNHILFWATGKVEFKSVRIIAILQ
jgi:hypothetical protein